MSSLSSITKNVGKGPQPPKLPKPPRPLSLQEQIDQVKMFCNGMGTGFKKLNEAMNKLNERISYLETSVSALIGIVGIQKVKDQVAEDRKKTLEAESDEHALNVKTALEGGKIAVTDVVAAKTLIVLQDKTLEGEIRFPSRVHVEFEDLSDEWKESLNGKVVGDSAVIGDSVVTVLEVYKGTEEPAAPATQE